LGFIPKEISYADETSFFMLYALLLLNQQRQSTEETSQQNPNRIHDHCFIAVAVISNLLVCLEVTGYCSYL